MARVKRLLALIAGGLGVGAFLRRRRVRPAAEAPGADDLRAKLAESKVEEPAAPPAADVDSRRAGVHERARQAIDDLKD
jgi:hypothetical protein